MNIITIIWLIMIFFVIMFLLVEGVFEFQGHQDIQEIRISEERLLFKIPQTPLFSIKWSDFQRMEIKLIRKETAKKDYDAFRLTFLDVLNEKSYSIELRKKKDFSNKKLDKIIKLLRRLAKEKEKKIKLRYK